MDDDSTESSVGNPEEGGCKAVQSDDDNNSTEQPRGGGAASGFRLKCRSREGTCGGVGPEERSDGVRNADSDELLIRIDLVPVYSTEC